MAINKQNSITPTQLNTCKVLGWEVTTFEDMYEILLMFKTKSGLCYKTPIFYTIDVPFLSQLKEIFDSYDPNEWVLDKIKEYYGPYSHKKEAPSVRQLVYAADEIDNAINQLITTLEIVTKLQ